MGLDDVTRDDHTTKYAELLNIQILQIDCFSFKYQVDGPKEKWSYRMSSLARWVVESSTERDTVTMLHVTRKMIVPAG